MIHEDLDLFFILFFFWWLLGFELRAKQILYQLSHSPSPR
jgi:hypothetical protein